MNGGKHLIGLEKRRKNKHRDNKCMCNNILLHCCHCVTIYRTYLKGLGGKNEFEECCRFKIYKLRFIFKSFQK